MIDEKVVAMPGSNAATGFGSNPSQTGGATGQSSGINTAQAEPAPTASGAAAAAPAALAAGGTAAAASGSSKVFLYPRNGQTPDQQARDQYDCYRFAVGQTGFDPMRNNAASATSSGATRADFERAQSACFEARGYSSR